MPDLMSVRFGMVSPIVIVILDSPAVLRHLCHCSCVRFVLIFMFCFVPLSLAALGVSKMVIVVDNYNLELVLNTFLICSPSDLPIFCSKRTIVQRLSAMPCQR